jgi:hypothetical protein
MLSIFIPQRSYFISLMLAVVKRYDKLLHSDINIHTSTCIIIHIQKKGPIKLYKSKIVTTKTRRNSLLITTIFKPSLYTIT